MTSCTIAIGTSQISHVTMYALATTLLLKQRFAFFIFHSTFFLTDHKNLQQDHCNSICNALMMIKELSKNLQKVIYIVLFGHDFHHKTL